MKKQEFLDVFDRAIRDAKSQQASRCIKAMNLLERAPESLACDVLTTTTVGIQSYRFLIQHKNPKIRTEATRLFELWRRYLYATGREQKQSNPTPSGDPKRERFCEILQTSLGKVANEVHEIEMKKRVASCDPCIVAVSVESALFKKLGCFMGPHKAKYRSILFNIGDSNNPDLRRKVLLGEINGDRLATMENQEMASDKIKMEVQHLKDKARLKAEGRVKFMMVQSDHMIMT